MKLNEYQSAAMRTKTYDRISAKSYAIAGLASEAGEVSGKWAKHIRDQGDFEQLKADLKKEAGDCLWMLAAS